MKPLLFFGVTSFFLLLDLLVGDWGVFAGFSCYISLCFAMAYGLPWGIAAALGSGFLLDAVCSRDFGLTAAVYLLSFAVVFFVLKRGRELLFQLLAGGAAGALLSAGAIWQSRLFGSTLPGPEMLTILFFSIGFGSLFFPLLIFLFDFFSARANLPGCIGKRNSGGRKVRRSISRSALKGGGRL